ncbi:hypothetical protein H5410_028619 [Solanum commersonii]|uniref:Uncharacterized protein n=1 Tax=Solanum commersonii TaxID=4109 RepID=A0A9J5Z5F5_SOLCO|nr:hypothetical protein H5410_028619 [Solanum commersonii]
MKKNVIELIETGPPLIFDPNNPWKIKKSITPEVLHQGNLVISFSETFDYILPYWNLNNARKFVNGAVYTGVAMWDVTNEHAGFIFSKLPNHDDYSLWILGLFNVYGLGVGDEIGLYWDPMTRELIETGPAWTFHSNNMMHMTKKITSQDLTSGKLWIPFLATFDCILPYWKLELARSLVDGSMVRVGLWDVTEQNDRSNRYEDGNFTFRKLCSDDYSLSCMTLINDRGLGVGDEIRLCWNPIISKFVFKLISKVCRKKTFSNTPGVMTPELIETGPPMIFDLSNYILPYWKLNKAKSLVNGYVEHVRVLNIMGTNYHKKYEGETVSFRKLPDNVYSLTIVELFNDSGLGVGDEIALFWDPRLPAFILMLLSKAGDSRNRHVLID